MRRGLIFFIPVFLSLFYFLSYPEVDPDLWGHLFFGREILKSGRLPLQNLYSYTAPDHPWINHEWLAEIIFYAVYGFLGSSGLVLVKVFLGTIIVWILDIIIRQRIASPLVRAVALIWTMAILSPGFNVRPQIFTYLFFTVLLFLFYRHGEGNEATLYWTPLLMALWVNLHGGFVAGLGALVLYCFLTAARALWNAEMRTNLAHLFLPLILSLLALALNPYQLDLLDFLARDLLIDRPITEWEPIRLWGFSFPEVKLAVLFVLVIAIHKGSLLRWDFAVALFAAFFAFRYQRHTPLFAIAVGPLLAEGIREMTRRINIKSKWIGGMLGVGVFAIALYQFYSIAKVHMQHRFQLLVSPHEYPIQAGDFLKRNGIRGNLAVPFDWGEYFIWKFYPEVRVSIDGRYTTAYPSDVIRDNFEWMGGGKGWRRLQEHYPTEIAITKRDQPVTTLLRKDPEWAYIYSDLVAFVFVRKTPSQSGLLEKFAEKKLLPPQRPALYFPG